MQQATQANPRLVRGDFIKVRLDNEDRPGMDGMVIEAEDDEGCVGLLFHYDRFGQQSTNKYGREMVCVGVELWQVTELDFTTFER
ncbi:hypothetical protein ACYPKM_05365 [Pseudomonas aeruginosa]